MLALAPRSTAPLPTGGGGGYSNDAGDGALSGAASSGRSGEPDPQPATSNITATRQQLLRIGSMIGPATVAEDLRAS